jgi:hypothetical protein
MQPALVSKRTVVSHASVFGSYQIHRVQQECGACKVTAGSTRADAFQLGCAAATPTSSESTIDINLATLLVNVEGSNASLSAGQLQQAFVLHSHGALQWNNKVGVRLSACATHGGRLFDVFGLSALVLQCRSF